MELYNVRSKQYSKCDMRCVLEVHVLALTWKMPALVRDTLNMVYCLMDTDALITNASYIYAHTARDSALQKLVLRDPLGHMDNSILRTTCQTPSQRRC